MQIIDTHIHPDLIIEFQKNKNNIYYSYEKLIADSQRNSVIKLFCISTTNKNFTEYFNLADQFEEFYFSLGIHPTELKKDFFNDSLLELKNKISEARMDGLKLIGVGETGFDFFHDGGANRQLQEKGFHFQVSESIQADLPLIIHTRAATMETFDLLSSYKGRIRGTIHAFQDDKTWAKKFVDLGFKLGIGGSATYPKNEHIREAIRAVGIDHILLETDSPFLPPQSQRGSVNTPKNCYEIGCFVADILKKKEEYCLDKIFENTVKLFLVK